MPLHAIPFAVAVSTIVRSGQSIDLTPGAVFSGIAGFFGGVIQTVIGDIITPVANAISWAGGRLEGWIVSLWSELLALIGTLPGAFVDVVDFVTAEFQNAENLAQFLYNSAWSEIQSVESTIGGFITNTLSTLQASLTTLLQTAISQGGLLWNWIYNTVLQPLYDEVSNVLNLAVDEALSAVQQFIQAGLDIGGWLWGLLSPLVQSLIDAALAGVSDIIAVVNGAWDFLVWIATHPLSWFTDQVDSFFAAGANALVAAIVNALESEQDAVVSWLDSTFGG